MKKIIFSIIALSLIIIFSVIGFKSANNIQNNDIIITNTSTNYNDTIVDEKIDTSKFEEAYVKRVVDGDTIIATIDNTDYRVRFIGINTPESTTKIEEYGKEASNYTKEMLTGKTVYLEKDVRNTDKYDRLLRYVWLEIPNKITSDEINTKMFNAILLINGYAKLFTYPPDIKYVEYFKPLEEEARKNNTGLWGI